MIALPIKNEKRGFDLEKYLRRGAGERFRMRALLKTSCRGQITPPCCSNGRFLRKEKALRSTTACRTLPIGAEKILASTVKQKNYLNISPLKGFPSPAIWFSIKDRCPKTRAKERHNSYASSRGIIYWFCCLYAQNAQRGEGGDNCASGRFDHLC